MGAVRAERRGAMPAREVLEGLYGIAQFLWAMGRAAIDGAILAGLLFVPASIAILILFVGPDNQFGQIPFGEMTLHTVLPPSKVAWSLYKLYWILAMLYRLVFAYLPTIVPARMEITTRTTQSSEA
jgi:hypothetical protein